MKSYLLSLALVLSISPLSLAKADINSLLSSITSNAVTEASEKMAVQVNLSGKQRMLTQKMTKEALLISLGINTDNNIENLHNSIQLFDKTLLGLIEGDTSLKLAKTNDTETLDQLKKVSGLWKGFKSKLALFEKDTKDSKVLNEIAENNIPLLKAMDKAVSLYVKNSGSDLNDLATVINLSGKQRMLTQKMTKEFLLIAKDHKITKNQESLDATIKLFETTLQGLVKGDESLSLPETKDKATLEQLAIVEKSWQDLSKIIKKESTDKKALEELGTLNLAVLTEMNKAVKMYEVQSKVK
ncbi:MAG: type IV pili methyl-accepting chemotaxis transducer N-terminal domain-containing protein [Thiotrichaceae bacterium]|nr:type IV pili methyl-accepting chemotaxis transducer N-terminal domain-containing protein [Thiotrichaceae bacterium]